MPLLARLRYTFVISSAALKNNRDEERADRIQQGGLMRPARGATCWADGFFWWRSCSRQLCCGLQTRPRTPRGRGTALAQSQSGTWGEDTCSLSSCKEDTHTHTHLSECYHLHAEPFQRPITRGHYWGLLSVKKVITGKELLPVQSLSRLVTNLQPITNINSTDVMQEEKHSPLNRLRASVLEIPHQIED